MGLGRWAQVVSPSGTPALGLWVGLAVGTEPRAWGRAWLCVWGARLKVLPALSLLGCSQQVLQ